MIPAALALAPGCRKQQVPAGLYDSAVFELDEVGAPEPSPAPAPGVEPPDAGPPVDPREELIDRTYDIVVRDATAYRATTAGVVVEGVSDPSRPRRLGVLYMAGSVNDLEWLGTIEAAYATACPSLPDGASGCPPPAPGTYVAAAMGPEGVAIVDVTNPASPVEAARIGTEGAAMATSWAAPNLYVADGTGGVVAIGLADPHAPVVLGRWTGEPDPAPYVRGLFVEPNGVILHVAAGPAGLAILDVSGFLRDGAAGHAARIGSFDTPGDARMVAVEGGISHVADGPDGLRIIDRARSDVPPGSATIGAYPTADMCRGVAVVRTTAYLAVGDRGLEILDVSDPSAPRRIGGFVPERPVNRVTAGPNGILFLANDAAGMLIVDASVPSDVRQIFPGPEPPAPER